METRYRLPRKVSLGFGVTIFVRTTTEAHLKSIMHTDNSLDGGWDDSSNTIWIDEACAPKKRKQVFFHELIHAINDVAALGADIHL